MALSGSFTGSTNNQYVEPTISWSGEQSIDGNYTDVTATLTYSRTNSGYTTWGTWSGEITINGDSTSGSTDISITEGSNSVAMSATVRVYHDPDGTKSITISATGGISGTGLTTTSISGDITLDTIPRASTLSYSSPMAMGSPSTITINRASDSFTHDVVLTWGGDYYYIATKTTSTSVSWTPPTATLAPYLPSNTSGAGTLTVHTWSGSTLIGSNTTDITLTIPSSVVPTISSISIAEAVSGLAAKFGVYVQGKSKLAIAISASGVYGSSINTYRSTLLGATYTAASYTTGLLTSSGTITLQVTITDSRGRQATASRSISVAAYSPPEITAMNAWRITEAGVKSSSGTRLAVSSAYTVTSVGGKNDHTYTLRYRVTSATTWDSVASGSADYSHDATVQYTSAPVISTEDSFVIRLEVKDYFTTAAYEVSVSTAFVLMDFYNSGTGIAFGKVAESGQLADFGIAARFRSAVAMDAGLTFGGSQAAPMIQGGSFSGDLNTIVSSGGYWCSNSCTNLPVSGYAMLAVFAASSTVCMQLAMSYTTKKLYARMYVNSTWTAWTTMAAA